MALQSDDGDLSPLTDSDEELHPGVVIRDAQDQLTLLGDAKCTTSNLQASAVIQALIDYAPAPEGKLYVARCILEETKGFSKAEKITQLAKLAQAWLDGMIFPISATSKIRTVEPSPPQTPDPDDTAALIDMASRGDQHALSNLLYAREDYKCAISRDLSTRYRQFADGVVDVSATEATYIVPFALNDFDEQRRDQSVNAAVTWDMLRAWTGMDIRLLCRSGINMPRNAMILRNDLHTLFGEFGLWFTPTGDPDTYLVNTRHKNVVRDRVVTFVDHSNSKPPIEPPDAQLLAIHAAFAKVFHASGAAEYVDDIWRDPFARRQLNNEGYSDISALIATFAESFSLPRITVE